MDMLIDGGWTGASDGSVDPVLNPATNDQIDDRAARDRRRCRARRRGRAARQGCDGGDARLAALRNSRSRRPAHRGEPERARQAALPRERQAHRRDDQRGRRRRAHLPRLCRRGEAHLRPLGAAELHPRPREIAGHHHARAAWRRRGDRAVQLSGRALEPQGRGRARRPATPSSPRRRRTARSPSSRSAATWKRPACRAARISCSPADARSARRWSGPKACR